MKRPRSAPPLVDALHACRGGKRFSFATYKLLALVLTFWCYCLFHATRKPPSVVKSVLKGDRQLGKAAAADDPPTNYGWAPFNGPNGQSLLGQVDLAFLAAYAAGMFFAGHLGDRTDLRLFLSVGMVGSGVACALMGMAYLWDIHSMPYFIFVMVVGGVFQSTGWPSVVSILANWYGKGKRGLVMGLWNAHTSLGNILGTVIAAACLQYGWGYAFIVPGVAITALGLLVAAVLVVQPSDVGLSAAAGGAGGGGGYEAVKATDGVSAGPLLGHSGSAGALAGAGAAAGFNGAGGSGRAEPGGGHGLAVAAEHAKLLPDGVARSSSAARHSSRERQDAARGAAAGGGGGRPPRPPEPELQGYDDDDAKDKPEAEGGEGGVGFWRAWAIPGVSSFAFCLFFSKLIAYTFLYWLPYYIKSTPIQGRLLSAKQAGDLSTLFDVGGVAGGVLAGHLSDKSGAPALVAAGFTVASVPFLWLYRFYGAASLGLNVGLMMAAGFCVNGPYALITTAVSADLGSHESLAGNAKALATVTAIIDGMGSIGAAIGPMLTGVISEAGGFDGVFLMLYLSALAAGLLLVRLCIKEVTGARARAARGGGGAGGEGGQAACGPQQRAGARERSSSAPLRRPARTRGAGSGAPAVSMSGGEVPKPASEEQGLWGEARASLLKGCLILAVAGLAFGAFVLSMPPLKAQELEALVANFPPSSLPAVVTLRDTLLAYAEAYPLRVAVGILMLYVIMQTFAIPGTISLSLLSGALYGNARGFALVAAVSTLGACSCYGMSCLFGRPVARAIWRTRLDDFRREVQRQRHDLLSYVVFLRVTPLLPNVFINVASPIVGVPFLDFLLGARRGRGGGGGGGARAGGPAARRAARRAADPRPAGGGAGTLIGCAPNNFIAANAGDHLSDLGSLADLYRPRTLLLGLTVGCAALLPVWARAREMAEQSLLCPFCPAGARRAVFTCAEALAQHALSKHPDALALEEAPGVNVHKAALARVRELLALAQAPASLDATLQGAAAGPGTPAEGARRPPALAPAPAAAAQPHDQRSCSDTRAGLSRLPAEVLTSLWAHLDAPAAGALRLSSRDLARAVLAWRIADAGGPIGVALAALRKLLPEGRLGGGDSGSEQERLEQERPADGAGEGDEPDLAASATVTHGARAYKLAAVHDPRQLAFLQQALGGALAAGAPGRPAGSTAAPPLAGGAGGDNGCPAASEAGAQGARAPAVSAALSVTLAAPSRAAAWAMWDALTGRGLLTFIERVLPRCVALTVAVGVAWPSPGPLGWAGTQGWAAEARGWAARMTVTTSGSAPC
ncbi:glycerol-3-phosphate transporter 1 [Scenedesmus sp. PABB004]|nr:glycerol-3-phosphate transporter 1 [Scenedesmus sp. PABB004]